jgi:hypothetical protein
MACTICGSLIANCTCESQQPYCDQCSSDNTCSSIFDAACVIYHPDDDKPTKLVNLGLPNKVSAEKIFETIDALIGSGNILLTAVDSDTIDLTANGAANHTLKADLKVSAEAGNQVQKKADGIFVPASTASVSVSPDAGNKIEQRANGLYASYTAQQITDLIKDHAAFRTVVCEILTECMGDCPGVVQIT